MNGERILIVEDNEKNLKLVRDVLQYHGYRTLDARSGEEAVELAGDARPDLILMDIELPGMSGFEALERLRAEEATTEIPVCALTAFAMREDRERCLKAGFDGYLVKPIDVTTFPVHVRRLLQATPGEVSS
jgi:two-component system, cell cycle response regulator DivK